MLLIKVLPNGIVQGTSIPGPYQQISSVPVALHQVNQQIRPAPLRVPPEKTNSSQQSNSFRNYGSESFYENKNVSLKKSINNLVFVLTTLNNTKLYHVHKST